MSEFRWVLVRGEGAGWMMGGGEVGRLEVTQCVGRVGGVRGFGGFFGRGMGGRVGMGWMGWRVRAEMGILCIVYHCIIHEGDVCCVWRC